jgi:hypothetical protein
VKTLAESFPHADEVGLPGGTAHLVF